MYSVYDYVENIIYMIRRKCFQGNGKLIYCKILLYPYMPSHTVIRVQDTGR